MYAIGAMPETRYFVPFSIAVVPKSPAAMPATCVAWSELTGSNGMRAYFQVSPAGVNARATITFGVVYAVFPFGKPGGYDRPDGSKNGCCWSTPSSMTPILIPWPAVARFEPQTLGAPISCGPVLRRLWYVTDGQTVAPGMEERRARSALGTTTARPSSTTP